MHYQSVLTQLMGLCLGSQILINDLEQVKINLLYSSYLTTLTASG